MNLERCQSHLNQREDADVMDRTRTGDFLFALLDVSFAPLEFLTEEVESGGQRFSEVGLERFNGLPIRVLGMAICTSVNGTWFHM